MLTSELDSVRIYTSADYVDVAFASGGSVLLSGRYYALNGSVVVSNLGELVEQYIAGDSDTNFADCTITAKAGSESANKSFRVMYCDRAVDVYNISDWLKQNFLTLAPFKRLRLSDTIRVSWYTTASEGISFMVYATFLNPDGNRDVYQYCHSGNGLLAHINDILTEYVYLRDIIAKIKSAKKIDSLTLLSVTVRCKDRSATFFIDNSLDSARKFYFVNCFNILESLILPCITTDKIKSDRSIASLGKVSTFYDVTNSKEYETETSALTDDECAVVEQMFTSKKVKVQWSKGSAVNDFNSMSEILITDFTSELSDDDLNKVKFTWQFADNTPKLKLTDASDIFDDNFNTVYS